MSNSTSSERATLQADALGLLSTVSLTAAYMAPAAAVIALFGPIVLNAGATGALVMLLGLLITLPSAVSFGMLAKELPSAGGVADWARQTLGTQIGRWVGLTTATYYILTIVFPPIVFGQLTNNLLLDLFGVEGGVGTWLGGALLSLAIAGFVTYRGVAVSSYLAFTMLMVQLIVMTALAVTFAAVAAREGTLSWAPLLPTESPTGWSGIFLALPLAMLSLICDAATPVSEETKDARQTIPLAIILTLILVGVWDVLAFGAFSLAAPPEELAALVQNDVDNPIPLLAERVWGPFKVLVTLVGMMAMIGALVPCSTAASRVLYALGRDGTLPAWLGSVHPQHRTPWNALHLVFLVTTLAFAPLSLVIGSVGAINWWGSVIVWFIIAVYFATNVCNLVYYWRFRREKFSIIWNLAVPLIAMTIQTLVVWQVVIKELWGAGWFGRSAQLCIVILSTLTAIYVVAIRDR
ncbi:APC family permease [Pirellulales bacterium]|nr:APC family permease [Pirellulales bacterium]